MAIFNAKEQIRKFDSLDFTRTNAIEILADKEVAMFLLSKNFDRNRNVSPPRVQIYRQAMSSGQWVLGDPLKFSISGKLIDGQHRLSAVPDNTVIPFVVLTGQTERSAETYDQGMRRNAIHIARIRDIAPLTNHHIAILKMMFLFRFGTQGLSKFTSQQTISVFEKYQEIREAIDFSLRYRCKSFASVFSPVLAVIARAYLSASSLSDADLDFFIYIFQGGVESEYEKTRPGRSAVAPTILRNTHQSSKRTADSGRSYRASIFYKTQSALNAYAENKKKVSFLKETHENLFPVPLLDQEIPF